VVVRLLVSTGILGTALGVGYLWRRSVYPTLHDQVPPLVGSPVHTAFARNVRFLVFTSRYCISCGELKRALEQGTVGWKEVPVEQYPEAFRNLGIDATPVLIELSPEGIIVGCWGPASVEEANRVIRARNRQLHEATPSHLSTEIVPGKNTLS